ncbi:MAG: hypothetical protein MUE85_24415 [Microscillaceae bacterium]|jgi:hypothetical protein|nr:hypothetical protein [Microscillaceae bacterium]
MKSIYETTNGSTMGFVNHHEEYYLIQLIGTVSRAHYQAVFGAVLEDAEINGYQKIIFNIRDLKTNPDLGRTWLTSQFIPKFYKQTGGLQLAVVNPTNFLEKKSIPLFYSVVKALGLAIHIKFFDNLMQARDWVCAKEDFADDEEDLDFEDEKKNVQLARRGSKAGLQVSKGKFKFKVHFDAKGRLESRNPLENILPKIKLSTDTLKDYFRELKWFNK